MKKTFKSILKAVLIVGFVLGLILVTGESDNMVHQVLWTWSWLAEMALCGWGLTKLYPDEISK